MLFSNLAARASAVPTIITMPLPLGGRRLLFSE
jgi:hypothetical protein